MAGASAATIAAVVIGGLAVGAAIGYGIRQLWGEARAVRAEEANVEGIKLLRETRQDTEAQLGRKLTQPEVKKMWLSYTAQLQELGFTQNAQGMWYRPRGALEKLLG